MKVKLRHGPVAASRSADAETRATRLLGWYDVHARALPWRISPKDRAAGCRADPYRVWLSEVMVDERLVAAVIAYFERFTRRWPDVDALAAAPSEAVMGAWAGLGYYARARNLHACARQVSTCHGGRFPATAVALKALPGIGDYTSAAIAAIAFDERAAVVDGNIERVVTRLFAIETPLPAARALIRDHVGAMTPQDRPGDFAQGMMDLGATICTPRRPACILCPLEQGCAARAAETTERFPVKLPKRAKPRRVGAAFVALRRSDGAVWLRLRPETGMLGGMAEPPTTGWSAGTDGATGAAAAPFAGPWQPAGSIGHGFTHFDLTLEVWRAEIDGDPQTPGWWSPPDALKLEALPTLMKKAVAAAVPGAFPAKPKTIRARLTS